MYLHRTGRQKLFFTFSQQPKVTVISQVLQIFSKGQELETGESRAIKCKKNARKEV